jgi:phosphocarrier protein FPr
MVGLVVVSHSRKLAEGVLELAEQMTRGAVAMEAAGGIDDEENPIGTDPMSVMTAIESVGSRTEDPILVIMDLGSALMSAEAALDFISDDLKARVRLCSAPVVEGTLAAAVLAAGGSSIDDVISEAVSALDAKIAQLAPLTGEEVRPQNPVQDVDDSGESLELELIIRNKLGLHARPAANLASAAGKFKSRIMISKGDKTVSAKSFNQVALLAVKNSDTVKFTVSGADASEAVAALQKLYDDNFGERDEDVDNSSHDVVVTQSLEDGVLAGIPASEGYAVGKVFVYKTVLPEVERLEISETGQEVAKLDQAISSAVVEISELEKQTEKKSGKGEAAIFGVHKLMLEDNEMRDKAVELITSEHINSEYAWFQVMDSMAASYRELDDSLMQARASDIIDAGGRVLRIMTGDGSAAQGPDEPSIIFAHELAPSDVAGFNPEMVLGIVTEIGGTTSHAAILSRSFGIPAVIGTGSGVDGLSDGGVAVVDGFSGKVYLDPDSALQNDFTEKMNKWLDERAEIKARSEAPAITSDGVPIAVMANIGKPADATAALEYGAEGVGLFRTEFLFQDRDSAPDEEEQFKAYCEAAQAMQGNPVIIRTLDIGGDKPVKYLDMPVEDNPFLGERGVRFCMARPELFKTQLRALIRAAAEHNIWIMYPMISGVAELAEVKSFQAEVHRELKSEGIIVPETVKTGIMIEVPSAAAEADKLSSICDFFSIGTNDLTQYVMAADRGNSSVSKIGDSLNPAVLKMIKMTCAAAEKAGIEVGMCGELAGNSLATPLLLGLGLNELSMSAPAVPAVKEAVRKAALADCRLIAEKALSVESGDEVRELLEK